MNRLRLLRYEKQCYQTLGRLGYDSGANGVGVAEKDPLGRGGMGTVAQMKLGEGRLRNPESQANKD